MCYGALYALLSNRSFFIKLQSTVTVYSIASSGRSRLLEGPAAKIEIFRRTDYVVNFKRRKSKSGPQLVGSDRLASVFSSFLFFLFS